MYKWITLLYIWNQNNTVNKEYLILKKGIIKWRIFEIKNMIFGKVKQR